MQMIKDFLLTNPSEDKDVDHFGQVFKETFAKFVTEFRYRGDPKVVYVDDVTILQSRGTTIYAF